MKLIIIYLFYFLLFVHQGFSQDTVILNSKKLVDPNKHIIYKGINNIITINNFDSICSYYLTSNNFEINKVNAKTFSISTLPADEKYIRVVKISAKGDTTINESIAFEDATISDCIPRIGEIPYYTTSAAEILKQDKINVVSPGCLLKFNFRIFDSELIFLKSNKVINTECNKDGYISDKQKDIIKSLKTGDKVIIYNVKFEAGDGCLRILPSILIEIDNENY